MRGISKPHISVRKGFWYLKYNQTIIKNKSLKDLCKYASYVEPHESLFFIDQDGYRVTGK